MRSLLFLLCAVPLSGLAQSTVDLCPLDTQAGPGTNFAAAMKRGGFISFAPNCRLIHVTQSYVVAARTNISGGNRVTIDSTVALGTNGMFIVTGTAELILNQLVLRPATAFAVATGQGAQNGSVSLIQARIVGPVIAGVAAVGTASAMQSTFVNIAGTALAADNVALDSSECDNCGTAVLSSATATVTGSTFAGGGSGVVCQGGTLAITGSHFSNLTNGAVRSWCATTIANSDFTGNKADSGAGVAINAALAGVNPQNPGPQSSSVTITGTTFTGNAAVTAGGALSVRSSATSETQAVLRHVTFSSNSADRGGAVDLSAFVLRGVHLDATAVLFNGNTAQHDGGGLHGANVSGGMARAIFATNKAGGAGGGIAMTTSMPEQFSIANAMFVGNSAASGSAFSGPVAAFINSTISSNTGTALAVLQPPSRFPNGSFTSQVSMANSIVSGNAVNCAAPASLRGPIVADNGHNDQFPGAACNPAMPSFDPQLDSMFVPAVGNAALNGGDGAVCAGPQVNNLDVWSQIRPRAHNCSMGAIEGSMANLVLQQNPGAVLPVRGADFSLRADPAAQTIADSTGIANYNITATLVNGFSGVISWSASNVPSGMSASFTAVQGNATTLNIVNGPLVSPGDHVLSVTGASNALTHSIPVTVTILRK